MEHPDEVIHSFPCPNLMCKLYVPLPKKMQESFHIPNINNFYPFTSNASERWGGGAQGIFELIGRGRRDGFALRASHLAGKALRVPLVLGAAAATSNAGLGTSPAVTAALAPDGSAGGGGRGAGGGGGAGAGRRGAGAGADTSGGADGRLSGVALVGRTDGAELDVG